MNVRSVRSRRSSPTPLRKSASLWRGRNGREKQSAPAHCTALHGTRTQELIKRGVGTRLPARRVQTIQQVANTRRASVNPISKLIRRRSIAPVFAALPIPWRIRSCSRCDLCATRHGRGVHRVVSECAVRVSNESAPDESQMRDVNPPGQSIESPRRAGIIVARN